MAFGAQPVFPFIIGCGRSGTTLVRAILNHHPELAIPRESHFIPILARDRRRYERSGSIDVGVLLADLERDPRFRRWRIPSERARRALSRARDLPDALRRLYALNARRRGKKRYGDKTPNYALEVPLIAALFPESRFVHVVRDGRNVALSLAEREFGPNRFEDALLYWRRHVLAAREAGHALGPTRYLQIRLEDLTAEPEQTVRTISSLLELRFDPAMLRYHEGRQTKSVWHRHLDKPPTPGLRDWRARLDPLDRQVAQLLAGDLLTDLDYDVEHVTTPHDRRAQVRATSARARFAAIETAHRIASSTRVRALRRALRGS